MIRSAVLVALALAAPLAAQEGDTITSPIDGSVMMAIPDVAAGQVRASRGQGAELKGLDKMSGQVVDMTLRLGQTVPLGRIEVTLSECRYPEDNPTGEAYAWLSVRDPRADTTLFDGWMIASSPALSALDDARYDVWVIRCTTS